LGLKPDGRDVKFEIVILFPRFRFTSKNFAAPATYSLIALGEWKKVMLAPLSKIIVLSLPWFFM
jgi:hypothetical protein